MEKRKQDKNRPSRLTNISEADNAKKKKRGGDICGKTPLKKFKKNKCNVINFKFRVKMSMMYQNKINYLLEEAFLDPLITSILSSYLFSQYLMILLDTCIHSSLHVYIWVYYFHKFYCSHNTNIKNCLWSLHKDFGSKRPGTWALFILFLPPRLFRRAFSTWEEVKEFFFGMTACS